MLTVPSNREERMAAMMANVVYWFNTAKLDGIQQIKNITAVVVRLYAPNIPPPQTGWIWVDTVWGKSYMSIGTTSVSDWSVLWSLGWTVWSKKVAVGNWSWNLASYAAFWYDDATGILTAPIANIATEYRVGNTKVVWARQTAAYTPDWQSTAYTGIDNTETWDVYAQLTDINALRWAYESLRAWYENLRTALQTHGLIS